MLKHGEKNHSGHRMDHTVHKDFRHEGYQKWKSHLGKEWSHRRTALNSCQLYTNRRKYPLSLKCVQVPVTIQEIGE